MKTIKFDRDNPDQLDAYDEAARILSRDGLVCLPCNGHYRILADLSSGKAVNHLLQSKRRTRKAPALVFIPSQNLLDEVAAEVSPLAQKLAGQLWPGPLTILFDLHKEMPRSIKKSLSKSVGKIGVRIPDDPVARRVVEAFGKPVLVSSANPQKKGGSASPAQIRKNFLGRVDLFLDAGDLKPAPHSTVVDLADGIQITRPGAIPEETLAAYVG